MTSQYVGVVLYTYISCAKKCVMLFNNKQLANRIYRDSFSFPKRLMRNIIINNSLKNVMSLIQLKNVPLPPPPQVILENVALLITRITKPHHKLSWISEQRCVLTYRYFWPKVLITKLDHVVVNSAININNISFINNKNILKVLRRDKSWLVTVTSGDGNV